MKLNLKHALTGALLVTAASNAHADDPIKVFLLAGQSNMVGQGQLELGHDNVSGAIGSLRYEVNNDPTNYGHLVDSEGDWATRDDVWVWSRGQDRFKNPTTTTGNLGSQLGVTRSTFGPELGFGHAVGDAFDEQVVLIKTAWGGKSLYQDFRPPSAVEARGGTVGAYYTLMVDAMQEALTDVAARYAGQTIEIEGLGWHQGWNDRVNGEAVAEYEANLNDLIADLRDELSIPDLKFVIGTSGMGSDFIFDPANREPSHFLMKPKTQAQDLVAAQLAVGAADANVITVDTHPFWREVDVSRIDEIEHWNQNGESYYLIGESMGDAMVGLVPEPSSLCLLALGGLSLMRRRR